MIHTFSSLSLVGQNGRIATRRIQYTPNPAAQTFNLSINCGVRHVLTFRTLAVEGVDLVDTPAVVEAGLAGALVSVDVAEDALVP